MNTYVKIHIPPCGQWRWRTVEILVKDGVSKGWVDGKEITNPSIEVAHEDSDMEGHKP